MSMWGTAFSFVSKGLEVVSAGLDIYASVRGFQLAEDMQNLQQKELRRQQLLSETAARREARLRTARLLASQGASGSRMSTVSDSVIGIGSSLNAGVLDLAQRTSFNIESTKLQERSAKTQAVASGISALGSAVAPAQEFADMLFPQNNVTYSGGSPKGAPDHDSFTKNLPTGVE